jgi:hypothetical protein
VTVTPQAFSLLTSDRLATDLNSASTSLASITRLRVPRTVQRAILFAQTCTRDRHVVSVLMSTHSLIANLHGTPFSLCDLAGYQHDPRDCTRGHALCRRGDRRPHMHWWCRKQAHVVRPARQVQELRQGPGVKRWIHVRFDILLCPAITSTASAITAQMSFSFDHNLSLARLRESFTCDHNS